MISVLELRAFEIYLHCSTDHMVECDTQDLDLKLFLCNKLYTKSTASPILSSKGLGPLYSMQPLDTQTLYMQWHQDSYSCRRTFVAVSMSLPKLKIRETNMDGMLFLIGHTPQRHRMSKMVPDSTGSSFSS